MRGITGAATTSSSRGCAVRKYLSVIIKAKDILALQNRGRTGLPALGITASILATTTPSDLQPYHVREILSLWHALAEAGELKGIRGPGYLSRSNAVLVNSTQ